MRKIFVRVAALMFVLAMWAVPALAAGGYVRPPVDLSHLASNPPNESLGKNLLKANVGDEPIPATYDLRSVGGKSYITSVKNQSPYGACWTFATMGAMESNTLKRGGSALDLSEQHLAWFAYKNSDKSKAFGNVTTTDFTKVMDMGGNAFSPTALYGRLAGPVLESEVAYGVQPTKSTPEEYTRALRLRDVYYLTFVNLNVNQDEANRNIVKRRIMESGAVFVNYNDEQTYYQQTTAGGTSFYYNGKDATEVDHGVLIAGWDDNYSKDNFKTKPANNGAWLIKNSWGEKWYNGTENVGDDGYFWMSYEQCLYDGSAFITEDANSDMKVYYYDALGWTGTATGAMSANVFKCERDGEYLTEVAFFTPDNNLTYEVKVYTGMVAMPSSNPISGSAVSQASGTIPFAGYHTVALDTPVALTEGQYFSVVLKLGGTDIPIEIKSSSSGSSPNAKIETGSFISVNGTTWQAVNNMNACIKAFTLKDSAEDTPPKITSSYPPDAVVNVEYYYKLNASGARPLTWSKSGELPSGLEFNTATGEITGTATEATHGGKTFSITVTNANGNDSASYTMNVIEKPTITSTEFEGYVGQPFTEALELSAGTASSWKVTTGKLPNGLKLEESTGAITGKPKAARTTTVPITASTIAGDVSGNVKFHINPKPTKPKISTSKLPDGEIGKEYSGKISFSGTEPVTLTIEGEPNGLTLDSETGALTGTPTAAGTFEMHVTASNIFTELNDTEVTKKVKLTIKANAPAITEPSGLPIAVAGDEYAGYSFDCTGTEPITWSASGLPKGMTLSASGDLAGTPTKPGTFNITLKASNSGGKAQRRLTFTVFEKPTVTSSKLSDATTGKRYSAKLNAKGTGPISWDIPELPSTLTLTTAKNGAQLTISGTPTAAEELTLHIKVSNDVGSSDKALTFKIKGVAPKLKATSTRGKTGEAYSGTTVTATGTLPITIGYEISDADKEKFEIDDLDDLGLSLITSPDEGKAAIVGTPNQSIKGLPIVFTATNVAATTPATKKVKLTFAGTKPAFTTSPESNMSLPAGSAISLSFTASGSDKITFTLTPVTGLTLTQDGNTATVSGTAPAEAKKKITVKVTAANADGKATKKVVIQTTEATTPPDPEPEPDPDPEEEEEASVSTMPDKSKTESVATLTLGAERDISSIRKIDADALEGYTIAAVLPEITVTESGLYDLEVDLFEDIEAGRKLVWFAFPQNRATNDDDEFAEFYDADGAEITETTEAHEIGVSVWLNSGDLYAPVIAVE